MTSRLVTKAGISLAIAVASVFALVAPASATVHSYDINMVRGRISVGSTNFDTPGATPATCIGTTGISGTIDDAGGADTIGGTLNISSSDFAAPFTSGRFTLTATGASTGTARGSYNPANGTFTGLQFPTIAFTIKSIDTSTCTVGATVCSGTATLTVSGGLVSPATLPLTTGEQVHVSSTAGSIVTTSGCGFPWGFVVTPGATLSIGRNPAYPADAGAIFEQV